MTTLKHKYGPLPLWAWLIIAFLAVGVIANTVQTGNPLVSKSSQQAALASTATANAPTAIVPTPIQVAATPTRKPSVPAAVSNTPMLPANTPIPAQPTASLIGAKEATVVAIASEYATQPANIIVLQHQHYTDSIGGLHFIGLVKNTGNAIAENIAVNLTLLDGNGGVVGTGSDSALIGTSVPPSKSVGFDIIVDNPPAQWAKEDIKTSADTYDPIGNDLFKQASNLTITGNTIKPSQLSGYVVRGQVNNGGAKNTQLVHVNVTAYDSTGQVVDVADGYAGDIKGIPPGQSASFEINLICQNTKVARYELLLSAYEK